MNTYTPELQMKPDAYSLPGIPTVHTPSCCCNTFSFSCRLDCMCCVNDIFPNCCILLTSIFGALLCNCSRYEGSADAVAVVAVAE